MTFTKSNPRNSDKIVEAMFNRARKTKQKYWQAVVLVSSWICQHCRIFYLSTFRTDEWGACRLPYWIPPNIPDGTTATFHLQIKVFETASVQSFRFHSFCRPILQHREPRHHLIWRDFRVVSNFVVNLLQLLLRKPSVFTSLLLWQGRGRHFALMMLRRERANYFVTKVQLSWPLAVKESSGMCKFP